MGVDPVDRSFKEGNIHAFNRYTYANNNPYKFVDPDGHQAVENLLGKEAPIVVIGNAFGALAAYAVGVTEEEESGNESRRTQLFKECSLCEGGRLLLMLKGGRYVGDNGAVIPIKPKTREVEFSKKEVLREEVEIYRQPDHGCPQTC
ncbi:hypothetical protein [Candidatus Aalborgicola defluviihabitans]|uniref:hypothetical protein n=1 Tax=Candidatus Aalborgicola defluviihabitans TaxID=3386187 RepID=UPI001EB8F6E2|nr:hypothetical protein [Burkholderiales bacterium]